MPKITVESERFEYHRSKGRILLLDIEKLIPIYMNIYFLVKEKTNEILFVESGIK